MSMYQLKSLQSPVWPSILRSAPPKYLPHQSTAYSPSLGAHIMAPTDSTENTNQIMAPPDSTDSTDRTETPNQTMAPTDSTEDLNQAMPPTDSPDNIEDTNQIMAPPNSPNRTENTGQNRPQYLKRFKSALKSFKGWTKSAVEQPQPRLRRSSTGNLSGKTLVATEDLEASLEALHIWSA